MNKAIIEGPDVGACGRFNIVVKNADGSVKRDYGWQTNLITNTGLRNINQYNAGDYNFDYITIGTGSGTPSVSDTQLFEVLTDYTNTRGSYYIPQLQSDLKLKADYLFPNGYNYGSLQLSMTATNIKNKNITEIGISSSSVTGELQTHAMITDETGTPQAITILEGEILEVQYQIFAFIPYQIKRGTIKLKKTPDMAIPEQYTEEEYDYQLQTFRSVNKTKNSFSNWHYIADVCSNFQIKVPDDATPGPVDFDKWIVPYRTTNASGGRFYESSIGNLFNPNHASNATFFVNMESEYRTKNLSTVSNVGFSSSSYYTSSFLMDTGSYRDRMWATSNKYKIDGYQRTATILLSPFYKDGQLPDAYYNDKTKGDNGLRGLFFTCSKLGGQYYSTSIFKSYENYDDTVSRQTPNMLVVFSKKGTGEGIKKEWGWFLEITFGFNTVGIDLESVKIVNASMDTSAKVLNQTHTLDLTYEEGATYNVEIQSLVENVSAEELVSVNGLTLTQVAQSGSFNVKVTVSKEGMVPRTFTQSFTIASSI